MTVRIQDFTPEPGDRTYCGGAGNPALPGEPTGPGGHTQLINQNEREIGENSWEYVAVRATGYQDDARMDGTV